MKIEKLFFIIILLIPTTAGDILLVEHALRCTQPSQPATVDCGASKKGELSQEVFIGYPYLGWQSLQFPRIGNIHLFLNSNIRVQIKWVHMGFDFYCKPL